MSPAFAVAAPARFRLSIPAQPASEALIELALQTGASIGGVSRCEGRSRPVIGAFTLKEALDQITDDLCEYSLVDARTVLVYAPRRAAPAKTSPPPPPPAELSEVLVAANRRSESASRVPAGVSVVGQDMLALTATTDAAGVARLAAGMTTTNLGAGRDKIMLRGLSDGAFTGRTRSTVGSFLDSTPLTYNAPDPDLRLADVAAIEVIRGPQGALFGSGSISGVYRIVTRKPELGETSVSITAARAWTEGGSPGHELETTLNLPLIEGRAALRVVAYDELEGGYLDDVNLRLSNVDQTTRRGGRAALRILPADDWTVTLSLAGQKLESKDTQYLVGQANPSRANRVRETHDNTFAQGSASIEGQTPWGRLTSSTAFVQHQFASQYDASAALSLFGRSTADLGVYRERARAAMVTHDTVLTSPEEGRVRWLAGVYAALTRETSPSDLIVTIPGFGAINIYAEGRKDRLTEVAVYGEAAADLGDGWSVSVGGRGGRTRLRTNSDVIGPFAGQTRSFVRKATYADWSPKLSLQHVSSGGVLVYGLISGGYRAGGFNSGGLLAPDAARASFRPDHLTNYEIGAKLTTLEGHLDVRAAVFHDLWRNIQTDQFFPSGLPYTANVGDGRNSGVEAEAVWRINPNWTWQVSGLVNDSEVTRVNPAFGAKVQNQLPGVPDMSFATLVTYRRALADGLTLILTGQAAYMGRSRLTFDPTLSPITDDYVSARLSAQLRGPYWRIAAFLENPTDSQRDTFAYGNPFSFGQVRQVTPQRPRTLTLTLSRTF